MEKIMSDNVQEIAKALAMVQAKLKHPKKDKDNPFFKSKYADLTQICETLQPLLSDNGLSYSQPCRVNEAGDNVLATILMHTSGQYIVGELKLQPEKNTPQGFGSAITYARRYCLASIVGVAPEDDDDDAEAAEGRNGKKELPKQFKPAPAPYKKPVKEDTKDGAKLENPFVKSCSECDEAIDSRVADFSMSKLGRPLCRECQKNEALQEAK